ncbi:hypothetical protein [Microbacterium sp. NIBRBAC000506063]|uniref:hypothetical protein n=1 Tax=Microbacterium sp. NIBRBAC000506063 TaxID=2734618 RepID=UPI001BB5051F|nr:hypothetical protein [Microbacterium sp. NIBRBAC000506063]QTV80349.1 hypothetical protein KAE78_05200 [Microbacterium sp. NIBRBAC000506063]
MTTSDIEPDAEQAAAEETPEEVPPKAWVTFGIFALFVVGIGSCMSLWMFD